MLGTRAFSAGMLAATPNRLAVRSRPCLRLAGLTSLPIHRRSAAGCRWQARRLQGGLVLRVQATAAPTREQETATTQAWERSLPLGPGSVAMQVSVTGDEQTVTVSTNLPGPLILHWGVEGGRKYKGGWRLPGDSCQPEGTVNYKNRALQTPLHPVDGNGKQAVTIRLAGDEASDFLNFVIKNPETNTWYDLEGTNFQIALRSPPVEAAPVPTSSPVGGAGQGEKGELPPLLPLDKIPQLPQELAGIWAYIKWEVAGCPNRSKEEADREYQAGISELTMLLRRGRPLDEVWQVARGEMKYADYIARFSYLLAPAEQQQGKTNGAVAAPPEPVRRQQKEQKQEQRVDVPEELVGIQAYLLWEQEGKPDGADFSEKARKLLEGRLRDGTSVADLEKQLKGPSPPKQKQAAPPQERKQEQHREERREEKQQERKPEKAATTVGKSMGQRQRNPLDFIKRSDGSSNAVMQAKPKYRRTPLTPLVEAAQADKGLHWYRLFGMGKEREMLVTVRPDDLTNPDSAVTVTLTTTLANSVLHWGVKQPGRGSDWIRPADNLLPPGSNLDQDAIAADTPFQTCNEGDCKVDWSSLDYEPSDFDGASDPLLRVSMRLPADHKLTALTFVVRSQDGDSWWRDNGSNFSVPLPGSKQQKEKKDRAQSFDDELSRVIVDCEVNTGAWTLMHRFNRATDLLNDVMGGRFSKEQSIEDSLARIYVWLRYSAIRQLTWQRNYNTQPRILGSAQERLTHSIADVYSRTSGEAQEWARVMLTTVGRGGNAQAVRDEILNIMHRNKISEKKGTWMEEWHQKLHNNTTPDDVPICEAYLAFLRANGDEGAYWSVLKEAGLTREMLASYDRPVKTDPFFYADKKDALIGEFENYLKILKSVHSGADLQASASAASGHVPGAAKGYLGYVLANSNGHEILPLIEAAVEARAELQPVLRNSRDVLYLDLALENVVRAAAERGVGSAGPRTAALVAPLLQNLALSLGDNEEVCYCLKAWQDLPEKARSGQVTGKDDALRAMAVIERVRRALAEVSDGVSQTVGPVSQQFGQAFGCESWAVTLFPEEVVRGGPAFAVSLALTAVEAHFRSVAEMGAWQVISPAACWGKLEVVPDLHDIQEKVYDEPTVLLVKHVSGEEEVPVGVVGVLSGETCDVLAHLAVRSRNMGVLFATCYEAAELKELQALTGKMVACETTPGGVIKWREADAEEVASHAAAASDTASKRAPIKVKIPKWCGKWVVGMDGFKDEVVGAKSKNLAGLRGKLPDSIALPSSITIPFSSFEQVLKLKENKALAGELSKAVKEVVAGEGSSKQLQRCRELVMQVPVPSQLQEELKERMTEAGINVPQGEQWDDAMHALKSVWASKYNDRAFLSCRKVGINFDDVRMAVLCQRIVPAQYAFVIHTTNPTNGDEGEIYVELVKGLGEAIVSGTVPGAALTFTARKDDMSNPTVLLYPSKGEGMFVPESLIFRSDSNGEDLQGYAGAGLYDSVTTATTERCKVDYSSDPLLTDPAFRQRIMTDICAAGLAIEQALGSAQDVEGVIDADGKVTVVQTRPQM
ncbi:hypothetical protein D9Q98_005110 [Chlorella vulgaris]|uniref:Pyruvate phosphate dikinase AMP/ATP-binding domain-containing protein n=1 Tax=Chlorella vulgaris TaxID=3077 RepID=A0A9D4TNP1_CHLVU|nr:hypothetical protein D9Q98_005110 [Chlorella vulgaris]